MVRKKLIKSMACIGIAITMLVGNVSPYVVTNQLVEKVYADEVIIGNSTFTYSVNEDGVSCAITRYRGSETEVVVPNLKKLVCLQRQQLKSNIATSLTYENIGAENEHL